MRPRLNDAVLRRCHGKHILYNLGGVCRKDFPNQARQHLIFFRLIGDITGRQGVVEFQTSKAKSRKKKQKKKKKTG